MASLRAFQSEIDEIHAKNVAEQRSAAALASPIEKKGKAKDSTDAPKPEVAAQGIVVEDDDDLSDVQVCPPCSLSYTRRDLTVPTGLATCRRS